MDTILQVLSDEVVPPSRLQPKTPRDLETICLRCLQKEPRKRYASAEDLAEDLRCYQEKRPIRARPVGNVERAWRWCQRNKAVAGLMVAVGCTLALGTAVAWWFALRAEAEAQQARESAQLARDEKAQAELARLEAERQRKENRRHLYGATMHLAEKVWREQRGEQLRALLEAQRPQAGEEDLRGFEWYYLWRLCHREFRTLRGHTHAIDGLAFSPDGKRLASASGANEVKVWDVGSGQEILSIQFKPDHLPEVLWGENGVGGNVAFSPDGQRLASIFHRGGKGEECPGRA
jgi:hypothetical protein